LAVPDLLARFIASGPWPQRVGLSLLVALARRPRGARLLALVPAAEQLAGGLVAMVRFEDPELARALGWDADAVVARGRELRRREGRP
jgi:hypothetical protein